MQKHSLLISCLIVSAGLPLSCATSARETAPRQPLAMAAPPHGQEPAPAPEPPASPAPKPPPAAERTEPGPGGDPARAAAKKPEGTAVEPAPSAKAAQEEHPEDQKSRAAALEAQKQVDELIQKMVATGQPWQERAAAARALGRLGPAAADACPILVEALAEDNDDFTHNAYSALRQIGDAAIPALAEAIKKGKSDLHRFRCAKALIGFHGADVALLALLKEPDQRIRYIATEALGRVSPPSRAAMPALLDLLGDPHYETARAASRALVTLRPLSVPGLEERAKSPNEQVRSLAGFALRTIAERDKPVVQSRPSPSQFPDRSRQAATTSPPPAKEAAPPAPEAKATAEKVAPPAAAATAPDVVSEPFVDVTKERGIGFRHQNGASSQKHMPETVGSGAAWLDYDGDGWLDLYLVQGHQDLLNAQDHPAPAGQPGSVLLRNLGGKSFQDVTAAAGVGNHGYGMGAAVGDFDNDGWPDLYVTNFGKNVLYHNERNGTFRDVTDEAGVAGGGWSTSAAWADLDGDGLLDLYVARYVAYDPHHAETCSTRIGSRDGKVVRIYCYPDRFAGVPDLLFKNLGNGKFAEVGAQTAIGRCGGLHEGKSLGVLISDFDNDGDPDVLVTNDTTPNNLWQNLGGMRFEEAGLEVGFALPEDGKAKAGMGIDRGDVDGDGRLDYLVTNFTRESNTLFLSRSTFLEDGTRASGMAEPSFRPLGFGARFIDYDLDGDLDLYVANGHVLDNAAQVEGEGSAGFEQAASLYQNDGHGRFRSVGDLSGAWFQKKYVGRGVAEADYDNDGDGDLLITNNGGPAVLLENRAGNGKRWIGIDLRVGSAGLPVLGARVEVEAGQARWVREFGTDGSYLVAHDPRIRIGLGAAAGPVTAKVRWPGTREFQAFSGLEPGRYHLIRRDGPRKG